MGSDRDDYRRERRHDEERGSRRRRRDEEDDYYSSKKKEDRRRRREESPPAREKERRPRRSGFSSAPPPGNLVAAAAQMGLVPVIPDASTKPRRELFVGNTPPGTTERALVDHLNAAMTTMRMTLSPGAPVIQCRVSTNFAFVELRSVEETDRALSLTGIDFQGSVLKIGRPSKYEGPAVTAASSWPQLVLQGGWQSSPSNMHADNSYYGDQSAPANDEKTCRELFIGNTTPLMSDTTIRAFLGQVVKQLGQTVGPGDPIISLRLSGHYAFVELRSAEETTAMLQLNGIPFMGSQLKIGRPSKYNTGGKSNEEPRWIDCLDKYRNGTLEPLSSSRHADERHLPLGGPDRIRELDAVTRDPSRCLTFQNILEETDPDAIPDNKDDAERRRTAIVDGVLDEVRRECSKYGSVILVKPVMQDVIVLFSLIDDAILAKATLRYKLFDDRKLRIHFVEPPPPPTEGNRPPPRQEDPYTNNNNNYSSSSFSNNAVPPPSNYY